MMPTKKTTPKACRVKEVPADGGHIRFEATCGRKMVGFVDAYRTPKTGNVELIESYAGRGKKIGTRLYEALSNLLCSEGRLLTSDTTRTDDAEMFWRKQYNKGRANFFHVSRRTGDEEPADPDEDFGEDETFYQVKKCDVSADFSGLRFRKSQRRR